ncbi:MAG: hypothetical protein PHT90_03605 [Bacilli bacterium]|nr:hypothetical protein [Bacilli bacterium]
MEKAINFKAIRLAWVFVQIALLVFTIVYTLANHKWDLISTITFSMAISSSTVFWIAKIFYTKKMTVGIEDEE